MGDVNQLRAHRILARLRDVAAELSGYDPAELAETSSFLDLGFDSLFLTQLASAFQGEYGLKITFRQLFDELPTLRALADHIDAQLPAEVAMAPQPAAISAAAPVEAIAGESMQTDPGALAPAASVHVAFVSSGASVTGGGLQGVMAQQLALMAEQIQLLRSLKGGATAAITAATTTAANTAKMQPAATDFPAAAKDTRVPAPKDETPNEAPELPKGFGPPKVGREERVLSRRQREHIQRLTERYNARTMGSKLSTQEHRPHHADPRTAAGFNRLWKEMVYPIVIDRSAGCHLQDIDGNKYIDILNGFGPNFLGHSPPFVSEALKAQIERGIEVGPQTPLAGEAAKLFCELTGMDRVSWVNTGSEAVQAAIRLSRTYTGRNKIVVFSGDYHGNFDEVLVRVTKTANGRRTFPMAPGIPFRAVEEVLVLDYGTDESLDIIRENASEIAAVLVEPVQSRRPELQPREFLQSLRELTTDEGIVLVFDEVITGFRICPGGAQEYFDVEADLATYGKIIGGGMPIGVVAGRARFMDTFDGGQWQYGDDSFPGAGVTFFAGTFVRHPLAIAAVHATLQYLKAQGPALQQSVNRRTTRMVDELHDFFAERGVKIHIAHFASQMFIRVGEEGELATLLFFHLRDRGIHVLENFPSYMTAAHTDEDVERIVAAFKDSVLEMQADEILPQPKIEPGQATAQAWRRTLPLTDGQREIWVASQMGDMASCAFNESDSVQIDGPLDTDRFIASASQALGEQEAFRYRFDNEGATQWVDDDARFDVPLLDLSDLDEVERDFRLLSLLEQQALAPFDLEHGPLVRAHLVRLGPQSHLFVLYCHHIVFDGYSAELVMHRIAQIHAGTTEAVDSETVPYSLYIHRIGQNADEEANASSRYWRDLYAEPPAPLDLPTDRPRESRRSYRGDTMHCEIDAALSQSLRDTAKTLKTSVNVLLLSSFQALLSRLSGQEDIVVGVPVAGQARTHLETVGYCVNALPVRAVTEHAKRFASLVAETQRNLFDAFDHQQTSLGEIVASLGMARDPSRLPLVEAIFNYSGYFSELELPGYKVATRENRRRAVYYDMFFNIIESGGHLVIDWDYCSDLFDASTIERWADHYVELLKGVVSDQQQAIGDLPLMSAKDRSGTTAAWGHS